MNAYLIQEEGDHRVWLAETMARALEIHWEAYKEELLEEGHAVGREDREYYDSSMIHSCALVGEIGNP